MAIINCPECNQEVSNQAEKCPKCAYPIKRQQPVVLPTQSKEGCFLQTLNTGCLIFFVIIGIIVIFIVFGAMI